MYQIVCLSSSLIRFKAEIVWRPQAANVVSESHSQNGPRSKANHRPLVPKNSIAYKASICTERSETNEDFALSHILYFLSCSLNRYFVTLEEVASSGPILEHVTGTALSVMRR